MTARNRYVPVAVHLVLLIAAAFTLPLSIGNFLGPPPTGAAAPFWLLGLFTLSIGLPFYPLAATNPLLNPCFARPRHRGSKPPYFLSADPNHGRVLAQLSYPV